MTFTDSSSSFCSIFYNWGSSRGPQKSFRGPHAALMLCRPVVAMYMQFS